MHCGQNAELVSVKLAVHEVPVGLQWVEVKSDWQVTLCVARRNLHVQQHLLLLAACEHVMSRYGDCQ
jgi:hypothetical protein